MSMQQCNLLSIPLTGLTLLEASAGTGKTYTIASLYVRLVLEQGRLPEQILVTTYTEAATAELKGRIRERLAAAAALFGGAVPLASDEFLAGLVAAAAAKGVDQITGLQLLTSALASFDLAVVSTIHGFCLRALQDLAFESGSLLDTELITDQAALIQEAVDDLWRERFFGPGPSILPLVLAAGLNADSLPAFVRPFLGNPKLIIEPEMGGVDLAALEAQVATLRTELADLWQQDGEAIRELLRTWPKLSRAKDTYRDDLLDGMFNGMEQYCVAGECWLLPADFPKWTTAFLAEKMTRGAEPPTHLFFDRCLELAELTTQRLLAFKWEVITTVRARLAAKKREQSLRSFDDLLIDLYLALTAPGGEQLGAALRDRCPVALIDEFQDTDPVQFDIFRRIYTKPDDPLFLIGDPKQAIYGFRGADVFAYLQAAAAVPAAQRYTLGTNWRSAPRLVAGVNRLFSVRPDPFLLDAIGFAPVGAGKTAADAQLAGDLAPEPLRFWFVDEEIPGKPVDVGVANRRIVTAVAAEICNLVGGGAVLDGRPVVPGDIAVIVTSHHQAGLVRDALLPLGIPTVVRSNASLFSSREALEVLDLLRAVLSPASDGLVRTALVGSLFGLGGGALAAIEVDPVAWGDLLERLADYRRLWEERGSLVLGRTILGRERVRQRLLGYPDGERRLTNLQHCFELLQTTADERRLGPDALLDWFGAQLAEQPERDEYQLRLETDAAAVSIVTIHASKGLEYPIVFCPFLWKGLQEKDKEAVTCHEGTATVRDFGSTRLAERRRRALGEGLAETVRLAYVALTRAKYRCYVVWGRLKEAGASSIAQLLHESGGRLADGMPLPPDAKALDNLPAGTMREQLAAVIAPAPASLAIEPLPTTPPVPWQPPQLLPTDPVCRSFTRSLRRDWRVASFTSLAGRREREEERPAHDEVVTTPAPAVSQSTAAETPQTIRNFPRGSRAGTVLHTLFEELEFTAPAAVRSPQVSRLLLQNNLAPALLTPVQEMLDQVLTVPLPGLDGPLQLGNIAAPDRLCELEFFLPLQPLTAERFNQIMKEWQGECIDLAAVVAALDFTAVRGYLRGFIDLVFHQHGRYYLVDWKSNYLGPAVADYGQPQMAAEMRHHSYPLQYLLYTVALHRYLALRLPDYDYDRQIGGVFYLFLRGVDAGNSGSTGIYADRLPRSLVEQVAELLSGPAGGADAA